jgi:N-acetyl-anhydromuramoyl-L-alanine amidase
LKIDKNTGLLDTAKFAFSPHHNERPANAIINLLVIHGISLPPGQYGSAAIENFFCGQLQTNQHPYYQTISHLQVSAHLLITRLGQIVQFVPFHLRAWHAGLSCFQNQENCNDFSIGIELEGTDDEPYEKIQYEQLANVIKLLQNAYPGITRERIVGHSDIAPGRKTDPGPFFDWHYLDSLLIPVFCKTT